MTDYIAGLVQRGLISPDAAQNMLEPIQDIATRHHQEGQRVKETAMDVLKRPQDYIQPGPSELGALSLVPIKSQQLLRKGETQHLFQIANETGEAVGHAFMRYVPRDKAVRVDNIFSTSNNQNALGTKEIRSLLPEIKRHFPDAEEIGGMRVSGARSESGTQGNVRMRLPGAPGGPIETSKKLDIKAVEDYLNSLSSRRK